MATMMRNWIYGLVFLLCSSFGAGAAELLILEQPGCHWCERWDEEIGQAYPKTNEGQVAPLRRVDITDPWPDNLADVRPERMTPTFILVENGKEVDRLRGYPGEHFFWPMLQQMLAKLPSN
ncbi:regulatory protein SoxS [Roseibium sp. TrichSKD4]|uniref:regulatory protein SoxS n=1 Tax=Roseibium sp. TrichSKD4 TaxID=744980 RepID=UPI0001E57632|nr:regulatory protein SoxS [Roseibium sp. TrichSKD4]